ncbi:hypothetical protein TNCV_2150461 [Trichonephila clavipes]|nr:hypothetical protein TNCV_2150461 [Trichonephila clavipes]
MGGTVGILAQPPNALKAVVDVLIAFCVWVGPLIRIEEHPNAQRYLSVSVNPVMLMIYPAGDKYPQQGIFPVTQPAFFADNSDRISM